MLERIKSFAETVPNIRAASCHIEWNIAFNRFALSNIILSTEPVCSTVVCFFSNILFPVVALLIALFALFQVV